MPQVTVYIREQDLEQWKAIEKKSEFIHNALNPSFQVLNKSISGAKLTKSTDYNSPNTIVDKPIETKKIKQSTCKQHGIDKNLCRMMKHD